VKASKETWELRKKLDREYLPSSVLEKDYLGRMAADKKRFFPS